MERMPEAIGWAVALGCTNPPDKSPIHGDRHWRCVAQTGLHLAELIGGVDAEFVVVFAQLHDVMRENDGTDPGHGERAGDLFVEVVDELDGWEASSDRTAAMTEALSFHNEFTVSAALNIGVAWDADRLQLPRVGIAPRRDLLSTSAAKQPDVMAFAADLACGRAEPMTWSAIERSAADLSTLH